MSTTFKPNEIKRLIVDEDTDEATLLTAFWWHSVPPGNRYWCNRHTECLLEGKSLSKTARRHLQRALNRYYKENRS